MRFRPDLRMLFLQLNNEKMSPSRRRIRTFFLDLRCKNSNEQVQAPKRAYFYLAKCANARLASAIR